jgi:hypothetical protein
MNRSIKPGLKDTGCTPEYVSNISCRFAEVFYQEVASTKYGIEFCCKEDSDKWLIKKELLNLKLITNPEACLTITNNCCPPCNVIAEIILPCDPPSFVIGNLIIV